MIDKSIWLMVSFKMQKEKKDSMHSTAQKEKKNSKHSKAQKEKDSMHSTTLVPSLQAGAQFGDFIFSEDSKFLFCCCGSVIKVYNTVNGECAHDLQGHLRRVTGVMLNPSNTLQLISCGTDGSLIYWDYLDGVILKKHSLQFPLYGIVGVDAKTDSLMVITKIQQKNDIRYDVMVCKKSKNGLRFHDPKKLIKDCKPDLNMVSYGCMKDCVAAGREYTVVIHSMKMKCEQVLAERKEFLQSISKVNKFLDDADRSRYQVKCVACHPSEVCVAAGTGSGKIFLWYNLFKESEPVRTQLHWHALPVKTIGFTPDGSSMLSGGHESVLVRWQTDNQHNRDFKPRMGAPLKRVKSSPDGTLYAVNNEDNVIQLLDINLKILLVYRGMTRRIISGPASATECPIPCGMLYDPRTRTLVTNGLPGHLQFYSMALNKQLFNLDIVGQNFISPEDLNKPKVITEVKKAAISQDGQWIATFEVWDDGKFTPERRLKFWAYSTEAQTFSLNTRVEHPHDENIDNMMFRPKSAKAGQSDHVPTLVTLGKDCCFKIWTLVDDTDIYRENVCWSCESVGFYRGLKCLCVDFSTDGSTLAIGFEHLLTLWDPENNVVRATLSNGLSPRENINHVKFGDNKCKHMAVVATDSHLVSWNLLSLTVAWTFPLRVSVLKRDPSSDLMLAAIDKKLFVFRPSSSEVLYKHKDISSSPVLDAMFFPDGRSKALTDVGWPGNSQIYLYTQSQQLVTLDMADNVNKKVDRVKIAQNLPQSALSSFLAQSVVREAGQAKTKDTMGRENAVQDKSYASLLQSNEPVSLYGGKYLEGFLVKSKQKKRSASAVTKDSDSDDNSGSSSSSESEDEVSEPAVKYSKTSDGSASKSKEEREDKDDMDVLLSRPTDWVKWCSTLSLE